jgi:hypothetical protein
MRHGILDLGPWRVFQVLVDDAHSNPLCVSGYPGMGGRVIRVFHDGKPAEVAFRSLDTFADAIVPWLSEGDTYSENLPAEYTAGGPRSDEDIVDSRKLLTEAAAFFAKKDDLIAPFLTNIACSLTRDVNDLASVLEWSDEYAREAAENRLKQLGTEEAAAALQGYDDARGAFDRQCIATLEANGLAVTECKLGEGIQIGGDAPMWLNTPVFYNRRNDADAMEYLMERVRALTALKSKRLPKA